MKKREDMSHIRCLESIRHQRKQRTSSISTKILGAALLFTLLFTLLSMSALPLAHAETYTYVGQWGTAGTGNGQLSLPMGIAIDSAGNFYVSDAGNNRIEKFSSTHTFLATWGSSGNGSSQFNLPTGCAVDSSGNLYVSDTFNNRIQKFASDGTFITQWGGNGSSNGQLNGPASIAVDSSGYVYVADMGNNRVQKFTSTGAYVTKWGTNGTDNGQFTLPSGIAVDNSGNVYVTDISDRIQKFTNTGVFQTVWGSHGSGDGQFNHPIDCAVDRSGNVYVTDTFMGSGNNRIQKFTSAGVYLTQWGNNGTGDGQFNNPWRLALDGAGNVYVADRGNNRIQEFSLALTVSVSPSSWTMNVGQSQLFTASTSGGAGSLSYQWYVNGGAQSGATASTFTFTAQAAGSVTIYVKVTDNFGDTVQSNSAMVTVNPNPTPTPTAAPAQTPTPTSTPKPTPTPPPTATYNSTITIPSAGVEHITQTNGTGFAIDIAADPGTNVTVTVNVYAENPQPNAVLSAGVTLTHYSVVSFNIDPDHFSRANVTIQYTPADVEGLTAPYAIYKYIPENNSYVELLTATDLTSQTLTVTLDNPNDPLFAIGNAYSSIASSSPTPAPLEGIPPYIMVIGLVIAFAIIASAIAILRAKKRSTRRNNQAPS